MYAAVSDGIGSRGGAQYKMIAIVIPSLDPDEALLKLASDLAAAGAERLLVVNDGSQPDKLPIFEKLAQMSFCKVIHHAENCGKGRALKNAFNYLLTAESDCTGVVTADADGQHSVRDIMRVAAELREKPETFVLGVRDFSGSDVPWKSRFGNVWSCRMFQTLAGVRVRDTQTGLRGIPAAFMKKLLNACGERFEFESTMLIEAGRLHLDICELTIETIYLEGNRATHFHPLRDSWQICRVLFGGAFAQFMLFTGSALLSALIDLGCFALLIKGVLPGRLFAATVTARVISSCCNYLMNRNMVFNFQKKKSGGMDWQSLIMYYLLCVFILAASYLLTRFGTRYCKWCDVVVVKAVVDLTLFILSFIFQRCWIFAAGKRDEKR